MRGFLAGTVVLIVLQVGLKSSLGDRALEGSNWFVAALRRVLSPEVAGVPQGRGSSVPNVKAGSAGSTTLQPR